MTIYPNWFDGQKYNFEIYLSHLQDKPNMRFLQIGVYTGDASVWLLDNILTGSGSVLIDVDTWKGSKEKEHEAINFEDVFNVYRTKTQHYDKVIHFVSTSKEFFKSIKDSDFDFIYIDGDHTSEQVAEDAENAWKVLKPKGIMAFDDYMWGQDLPPHSTPRPAIDAFLEKYEGTYDLLTKEYQVWIQKNDN
jgi:predicted O-methyltransferase YrrM